MSILNMEELEKIAGGSFNPKTARVFSVDGPTFAIYDEPSVTAKPLVMVSSGSEWEVDPGLIVGGDLFPGTPFYVKMDDFYWINYNYHVYLVKAKEVRIEWL